MGTPGHHAPFPFPLLLACSPDMSEACTASLTSILLGETRFAGRPSTLCSEASLPLARTCAAGEKAALCSQAAPSLHRAR